MLRELLEDRLELGFEAWGSSQVPPTKVLG